MCVMALPSRYLKNWAPIAEFDDMEFEERWQEKLYRLGDNYTKYKGLNKIQNVYEHKSLDQILV